MKVVAKINVKPLARVFNHLLKSQVSPIQKDNHRGLRVSIPFNNNWLRLGISRDKVTTDIVLFVQGSTQKDGPSLFEFTHTGKLNTAKEFQTIFIQLLKKAIDEFGTLIATQILNKAIEAIQKNQTTGEPA